MEFKINTIVVIACLAIEVLNLCLIPLRIRKAKNKAEAEKENKEETVPMSKTKVICIFAFSFILTALCLKIYTGMLGNIVLCLCGVLGVEIGVRELTKQY